MYSTVYEISIFDILPQIIVTAVIIYLAIGFISNIKNNSRIEKIVIVISFSIAFVAIVLTAFSQIEDSEIYVDYLNGNYKEVEGSVTKYIPGSLSQRTPESFYINDTYFEYYDGWNFGYSKYNEFKENEKLKIAYIYDEDFDENRIVKISKWE